MDANAARENRCQESEDVMRTVRGERAAPSARAACPGDAPALEIPNPLCLIGPGGKFRTAWLPGPTPFERGSSGTGSSGTGSSGTGSSGTGSSGTGSSGTGSADDSAANHHAGGCREKRKHPPRPRANCRDRRGPRLRCSPNQGRVRVLTPARVGLLGVGAPRDGSWASPGGHMSTGHMSTEHMTAGHMSTGHMTAGDFMFGKRPAICRPPRTSKVGERLHWGITGCGYPGAQALSADGPADFLPRGIGQLADVTASALSIFSYWHDVADHVMCPVRRIAWASGERWRRLRNGILALRRQWRASAMVIQLWPPRGEGESTPSCTSGGIRDGARCAAPGSARGLGVYFRWRMRIRWGVRRARASISPQACGIRV
jgi:hypothetical protein